MEPTWDEYGYRSMFSGNFEGERVNAIDCILDIRCQYSFSGANPEGLKQEEVV